jgi:hypothetical protein
MVVKAGEIIMDRLAEARLINWAVGGEQGNEQTREHLSRELREYADRIAGASPSPAESILAETVALCWFALRMSESAFADASASKDGLTMSRVKFHQMRIDRAHARLMSALKTLATVRRLAVPAVQINVARQQVNQQIVSSQTPG